MPSLFALFFSSAVSYWLDEIMDGWFSQQTSIIVSMMLGTILFAAILWGIKRLRGE